jgi:hypothetical protein
LLIEIRIGTATHKIGDRVAVETGSDHARCFTKKAGAVIAGREIRNITVVDLLQEIGVVDEPLQRGGVVDII